MTVRTIAFYNWRYPYGGGEVVTRHLAGFFHRQGYKVILYTQELIEPLLTAEDRAIFDFETLPLPGQLKQPENVRFLTESISRHRIDCLIVQGVPSFPFAEVRHAIPACKLIFCLHNKPLAEVCVLRQRKCSEIGRPTLWGRIEYLLLRRPMYYLTDKLERKVTRNYAALLPHIDRFLLLCPQYKDDLEDDIRRWGLGDSGAYTPKLGAILNPIPLIAADTTAPKQKIVLYAGRLERVHKRVDRLLKIWKRIERLGFPEWKLVIAGGGDDEQQLRLMAEQLGLRNIEFIGHQTDMAPYYRKATFLCLTSNFEGLPMCLMEGQQYGVIPVSFDSYAGIREITRDGQCGIVVPAFSLRKYTRMLASAMTDTRQQESLRARCFEAAERYDIEKIGHEWLRLFDEL